MEWVALTDKLIKQMEIELVETKFMTHLTGGFLNGGTPKSSILIGFSIINHPFWGTPIYGNHQLCIVVTAIYHG